MKETKRAATELVEALENRQGALACAHSYSESGIPWEERERVLKESKTRLIAAVMALLNDV